MSRQPCSSSLRTRSSRFMRLSIPRAAARWEPRRWSNHHKYRADFPLVLRGSCLESCNRETLPSSRATCPRPASKRSWSFSCVLNTNASVVIQPVAAKTIGRRVATWRDWLLHGFDLCFHHYESNPTSICRSNCVFSPKKPLRLSERLKKSAALQETPCPR